MADDDLAKQRILQTISHVDESGDAPALYAAVVAGLIVAAGRGMRRFAGDLIERARAMHATPQDDASLVMASIALCTLQDTRVAYELVLRARAALAQSVGELGWAYAQADGIEVATLARMDGVEARLLGLLERLAREPSRRPLYDAHLVDGLAALARQGRCTELVRTIAIGVMDDVTEQAQCGARYAPDEIDSVNELLRLCGAGPSHGESGGT